MNRMLAALVVLAGLCAIMCGSPNSWDRAPEGVTMAPPAPSPSPSAAAVEPSGAVGQSWEDHGVHVQIIGDDWGEGTCHVLDNGVHCREFLITNNSQETIYPRTAIFNGPSPGCGAYGPDGATNDPNFYTGPGTIPPGQAGVASYCLTVTKEKCNRIQADDSWGPLGVFVVGDVFDFQRICATPTPPPCVDVEIAEYRFHIRNVEQTTVTYDVGPLGAVTLQHGEEWDSGWVTISSLVIEWRDRRDRRHRTTLENCDGEVRKRCHTDVWMQCRTRTECVYP